MIYSKKCSFCESRFTTKRNRQLFCSKECYSKEQLIATGRSSRLNLNVNVVGSISEYAICIFLLKKGYQVFKAVTPFNVFDIIATKENSTYRIEARSAYKNRNNKLTFPKKISEFADIFALYVNTTDEVFFMDKKGNIILL